EARQGVRRLAVLPRRVPDHRRILEAACVPLPRAPDRPGEDARPLVQELVAQLVIALVRREVALPGDQLHAPPQALVLASELRLEVRRQHEEERRAELEE